MNQKVLMSLAMATLLVACKSTPMKTVAVEEKSVNVDTATSTVTDNQGGAGTNAIREVNIDGSATDSALRDPNNILSKRNIYFDFDRFDVKPEFKAIIDAHARYLTANQSAKVVLQGNADERGTREYNLSLGQRRSVAVKNALNVLGVSDNQIETVSFGEEKATPNCADETCHGQNRRVDIVYENE